jgi:hypothetical protein
MYLPIELNTPILAGRDRRVARQAPRRQRDAARARGSRGTLIASGFIAGARSRASQTDDPLRLRWRRRRSPTISATTARAGNWIGLAMFVALGAFPLVGRRRASEPRRGRDFL